MMRRDLAGKDIHLMEVVHPAAEAEEAVVEVACESRTLRYLVSYYYLLVPVSMRPGQLEPAYC